MLHMFVAVTSMFLRNGEMNYLTTARLLMEIQAKHPDMRYSFIDGSLVISIPVEDGMGEMFEQARKMFESV